MSQIAITRKPNPIKVKGVYFHSFEKLKNTLLIKDFERDCLVSDLTMGAWRSHWVAREFISQLNLKALSPRLFPRINIYGNWENGEDYGLMVGKLIDAESSGDKNTIQAHHFALQILMLLQNSDPKKLLLIGPKFTNEWGEENKTFLNFLAQGLENTPHELYFVLHSDNKKIVYENLDLQIINKAPLFSVLPPQPAILPGLLNADCLHDLKKEEDYITLPQGWALLAPTLRKAPQYCFGEKSLRFLNDDTESWAKDFVAFFQPTPKLQLEQIMETTGRHFSEGGFEIAFKYINKALEHCNDEIHQAILQVQAQGMRIALLKFQEAASQPVPESSTIPNNLLGSLYLSKAWGLVMLNKPNLAEIYFKKARRTLIHFKDSIYYLYLLNISALNKVKLKKIEAAFEIEKEIEERMPKLPKFNWQLYYVNCINQARLYKKTKTFKKSEKYYQRAFSTTLSLRSESDLIYTNFCSAQLEGLKGNHILSFLYLYRCIVHWLSMEVPESIAPRVANAILDKPFYQKSDLPNMLSKKLTSILIETTKNAKLLNEEFEVSQINPDEYVVFNRLDIQESVNMENVVWVGNPGWAFLIGNSAKKPVFQSPHHNILSSIAFKFAEKAIPAAYIPSSPIVLVDDQFGCEMPATKSEAIETALRTGVNTLIYRRKKYIINKSAADYLENNLRMVAAPGIDFLYQDKKQKGVEFKRYLEKVDLNGFRQHLFEYINDGLSVEELAAKTNVRKTDLLKELRAMEQRKLVKLELDPTIKLREVLLEEEQVRQKVKD